MLIGISGKIGSGKDTVGKIIQGLIVAKEHNVLNPNFEWIEKYHINSSFEIKKFADTLKDIVCLLIGCTRKQLEDHEFKDTELGEDWWYYKFDGGIMIPYLNNGYNKGEEPLQYLIKPTPRLFLQLLGTEAGRNIIHPNIWVNALFANYKIVNADLRQSMGNVIDYSRCFPNWIITDMRFPNELEAIKKRGGITIRVSRSGLEQSNHPSETSLDSATFDFTINNDSSIEDLIHTVSLILKREKII